MRNWIYLLVNLVPGVLSKPARWIADRIVSVFEDGINFAKWIGAGASSLADGARWIAQEIGFFTYETYTTLRWFITTRAPALISWAGAEIRRWVSALITGVVQSFSWLVDNLRRGLTVLINGAINQIAKLTSWVVLQIASLYDAARRLIERVFGTWASPARMVEWILGALWSAVWRQVYQRREQIVSWILRTSGSLAIWLARELERILVKLI